jgi:hypothetical protein
MYGIALHPNQSMLKKVTENPFVEMLSSRKKNLVYLDS